MTATPFHVSFPDERRVSVDLTPQVSGEQKRLHEEEGANRHLFPRERMNDLLAISFMIRNQQGLAGFIGKVHGTRLRLAKVARINLP